MQCDKHVVKMVLETAQLLCSVWPQGEAPYRRGYYNHPCAKWTRASRENFEWLSDHGIALCDEFEFRYGHVHASRSVIEWCRTSIFDRPDLVGDSDVDFYQAVAPDCKSDDVVEAYRKYYIIYKRGFARWDRGRSAPSWWTRSVRD